jgi:hypothetical protein
MLEVRLMRTQALSITKYLFGGQAFSSASDRPQESLIENWPTIAIGALTKKQPVEKLRSPPHGALNPSCMSKETSERTKLMDCHHLDRARVELNSVSQSIARNLSRTKRKLYDQRN